MSWHQNRKLTTRQIFTLLMAGSVFCLIMPHRMTARFDGIVSRVISPFTESLRNSALSTRQTLRQRGLTALSLADIQKLQDENQSLKARNANLRHEMSQKDDTIDQLANLRQCKGMARLNYVIANVTGSDSSKERQSLKLDQGTGQFIEPGQLVIAPTPQLANGNVAENTDNNIYSMAIVGRISKENLGAKTAAVQLINDPGFRMTVVILPGPGRTDGFRAQGILQGLGLKEMSAQFEVEKVPSNFPVEPGDAILIDAPKLLPVNMIAGFVKERNYDEKTAIEWDIKNIQPALNLYDLQKVYVIVKPQPSDNTVISETN